MKKTARGILIATMVSVLASELLIAGCHPASETPSDLEQATQQLVIDLAGNRYEVSVDQHGKIAAKVAASSADGSLSLSLGQGTAVLDQDARPLQNLQAAVNPSPPPPPENANIIGTAYSFSPQGASFNPWLTLTLSYDPQHLPPATRETDLYLACHDGTNWQLPRYRRVDTEAHTVTTQIYHFSTCAILGLKESVPPTPTLATGTAAGKLAPDFQLEGLDGQTFSLSSHRGEPVLLNFWATWCTYCVIEMPILEEIYQEWSDKGLVMATIDVQESPSQVKKFMQHYGLSLPVLLDPKGEVAKKYNISAFPTTYFIDKDGIIRDKKIGAFTSQAEIEKSLGKIFP